jgi:CubicO group peptidase (beta-lactamase class C family)
MISSKSAIDSSGPRKFAKIGVHPRAITTICDGVLLLCITFSAGSARAEEATLVDEIEALLPPHVGVAVMAIDDGHVVFKHVWGRRCHDRLELCTPATNFRLASVSKQFTAAAVMLLVDRRIVNVHDTLDRYFPGCPDYWRRITLHHLLTHTSGLPDYEPLVPEETTLQLSDLNVLALLLDTDGPVFEPGTKFAYSNSGYTLLGLVVEAAAQRPFHDFLKTEVLQPVGMEKSVLYVRGMNSVANRAFGHVLVGDDRWSLADQSVTSAVRGDGGVYASLDDLERWLAGLDSEELLSPSSYQAMWTSHVKTDRGDDYYGYGWFIGTYRGQRRQMHAGSTRGFSTMLQRFPDRHAAVVILLNRSAPDPPGDYFQRIVDRLLFVRPRK